MFVRIFEAVADANESRTGLQDHEPPVVEQEPVQDTQQNQGGVESVKHQENRKRRRERDVQSVKHLLTRLYSANLTCSVPNKRQHLNQVTGPVKKPKAASEKKERQGHLLEELEDRARDAINLRRKNNPMPSSVSITAGVYAHELVVEIGNLMVVDMWKDIERTKMNCTVCYMIAGLEDRSHESGGRCPKIPLGERNEGWNAFKEAFRCQGGVICFKCCLPRVRRSLDRSHRVADIWLDRTEHMPETSDTNTTIVNYNTGFAPCYSRFTSMDPKV